MFKFVLLFCVFVFCTAFRPGPIFPPHGAEDPCEGAADCIHFLLIVRCMDGDMPPPTYPRLYAVLFDTTANRFTDHVMVPTVNTPDEIDYQGAATGLDTSHVYQMRFRSNDFYITDWSAQTRPPGILGETFGFHCQPYMIPLIWGRVA